MSICRGCGKKIVWGTMVGSDLKSKKIPLDPAPPVYRSTEGQQLHSDGMFIERASDAMVSHFATCPKANEFSGRSKQKIGGTA